MNNGQARKKPVANEEDDSSTGSTLSCKSFTNGLESASFDRSEKVSRSEDAAVASNEIPLNSIVKEEKPIKNEKHSNCQTKIPLGKVSNSPENARVGRYRQRSITYYFDNSSNTASHTKKSGASSALNQVPPTPIEGCEHQVGVFQCVPKEGGVEEPKKYQYIFRRRQKRSFNDSVKLIKKHYRIKKYRITFDPPHAIDTVARAIEMLMDKFGDDTDDGMKKDETGLILTWGGDPEIIFQSVELFFNKLNQLNTLYQSLKE